MDKIKRKVAPTTEDKTRDLWKERLTNARTAYKDSLNAIRKNEKLYDGMREVNGNPNTGTGAKDVAINVRNIEYELVESQVDSSIPMPKVTAIHEEDEELARTIEKALVNKIKQLRLSILNDTMERTVPIQGGDFFLVEWDNNLGYHANLGDVDVTEIHPRQLIPQPGVTDLDKMDYVFVQIPQTKDFVKKKYGVDVSDAEEEFIEIRNSDNKSGLETDIVTINIVFHRGKDGKIGRFTWCDDYTLENLEDYQARITRKCADCGSVTEEKQCAKCGSNKFVETEDKVQRIHIPIMREVGIDPQTGKTVQFEAEEVVAVDYYKPGCFPIILRKNVSKVNSLLGYSDVAVIEDQQDLIKKIGSKAAEKTLKGGSIVTLPRNAKIETTDKELKITRLDSPDQKAMIDILNMQVNINQDLTMINKAYDDARSTLGITDSYQGKYDPSATSGVSKQYAINQAAGRLESKRVMKSDAYAKLYEMIFKFWLAYADDPLPISGVGINGEQTYNVMDKRDFLKKDAAGQYYWNDEFMFETDPTSTLMANREAMWSQIDMKLQSGAFGQLGTLETMRLYWSLMEKNHYPNAGDVLRQIEMMLQRQEKQQEAVAQIQGGEQNEVSGM